MQVTLLWEDQTRRHLLASTRLYFLPEDTPKGRTREHGEVGQRSQAGRRTPPPAWEDPSVICLLFLLLIQTCLQYTTVYFIHYKSFIIIPYSSQWFFCMCTYFCLDWILICPEHQLSFHELGQVLDFFKVCWHGMMISLRNRYLHYERRNDTIE